MAITIDDFNKIWASTSPLTPYTFSESNYKEGWNFIGSTPPSRQMWDGWLKMTDEKCQYLYNHEDVPVGHEYFTFNPHIPQGSLPLFGGEYSRETYSALWNWVQEQTGYLKTEAEWQTLATANNGNVPYYSDGDGSTTFRVPALNCWMRSANGTVSEVGSYLQAGLPNITGSINQGANAVVNSASTGGIYSDGTGALYDTTSTGITCVNSSATVGSNNAKKYLVMDASRSSSIYGNSSTVQPASVVGMWLVKAYGTIADTGTINEQAYIDDRFNASKQYTDDKVAPIGSTYFGEWIANSSSTTNVELTQKIENVPMGKYLAIVKMPPINITTCLVNIAYAGVNVIGGWGVPILNMAGQTAGSFAIEVTNSTNEVVIISAASTSVTFSNVDRGGLTLVRISG